MPYPSNPHPRIWLTPTILTRLRALAAAGDPRWLALKTIADLPASADLGIETFALAYQVTGDLTYAQKAISLAQAFIDQGIAAVSPDSGYYARSTLPALAVVWDWCHDALTPQQQTAWLPVIEAMTDWVWPDTNAARVGAWAVDDPDDNYYYGFLMTWVIGLAFYGESAKAAGYIDLARHKWFTRAAPALNSTERGGYFIEGTNYGTGSMMSLGKILAANLTATGEDLFNDPTCPWPLDAVLTKIYLTVPTRDFNYPGGDQARVSTAPLSDYDRTAVLIPLGQLPTPLQGYAKWWLDHANPNQNLWSFTRWAEFLWYVPAVTGVDYTGVLPTTHTAVGAGLVLARSDWSTDATLVTLQCGPNWESHSDHAANEFLIYRQDWLAGVAKLWSHSGEIPLSSVNNCPTIGGHEQVVVDETQVGLIRSEDTAAYGLFSGEATAAYQVSHAPLLNFWRRDLLYLKPSMVVVFDRIDAKDPTQAKVWHLNTLQQPQVTGNAYAAASQGRTLYGHSLLPAGAPPTPVQLAYGGGTEDQPSSWRLDVTAPTGSAVDYFLQVLEASAALTPTAVTPVTGDRNTLAGAAWPGTVVLFDAASTALGVLTYTAPGTAEHTVVTDQPDMLYTITAGAYSGSVTTSAQGVARFALALTGSPTITLTPAGSPSGSLPSSGGGAPAPVVTPPVGPNPSPPPVVVVPVVPQGPVPVLPVPRPLGCDNGLRPRFNVAAFEDLLCRRGRPFLWERARRCPCQNPRTRSPLEDCPQCHGVGWAYTPQGIYRGAILGITANKAWARFGEWLSGDAQLTFSADLLIGDKDRITLQTGEYRESVVLTRGGKEIVPDPTVFEVLECGDDTTLYVPGRDFTLQGAQIVWRGHQPAAGSTYSVLYRARPTYMVWLTLPQIRAQVRQGFDAQGNAVFREMPRKVALRRWIDFVRAA